jgi:hypothetical protein
MNLKSCRRGSIRIEGEPVATLDLSPLAAGDLKLDSRSAL